MSTHAQSPNTAKSSLLRRLLMMTLAAVPTMIVAVLATWALVRFLSLRDALGTWRCTVHDDHGVEVGSGQVILVAEQWHVAWDGSPPFVRFSPDLAKEAGVITLNATGAQMVTGFPQEANFLLVGPQMAPDGSLACGLDDGRRRNHPPYIEWTGIITDAVIFRRFDIDYTIDLPVTATMNR